jgi:hypothetical protein
VFNIRKLLTEALAPHFKPLSDQIESLRRLMTQETKDVIKAIDDATNKVAARIQKLIDLAAQNGSVSEAEIRAALLPELDRLTALGADPDKPVPPDVP